MLQLVCRFIDLLYLYQIEIPIDELADAVKVVRGAATDSRVDLEPEISWALVVADNAIDLAVVLFTVGVGEDLVVDPLLR